MFIINYNITTSYKYLTDLMARSDNSSILYISRNTIHNPYNAFDSLAGFQ